jgi:hypothetical protein
MEKHNVKICFHGYIKPVIFIEYCRTVTWEVNKRMEEELMDYGNIHEQHVHDHTGITTCEMGHCHIHPGITSTPLNDGSGRNHFHRIIGGTTYDHGHFHSYDAATGPAIMLPQGFHTHFASFSTSFNEGHSHRIMGFTTPVMVGQ